MIATRIEKCHPSFVHMRFPSRIMAFIICHCSGGDDDHTMPRMRVPAGASPGCPDITLHIDV